MSYLVDGLDLFVHDRGAEHDLALQLLGLGHKNNTEPICSTTLLSIA